MARALIAILLLLSAHGRAQAPEAAQTPAVTVIRAGMLVDPERGTAAANQIIVVENGKVTAVGAGVSVPAGATVIDLSRYTVLPGLFDAHTHLCMDINLQRDEGSYFYTTLRDPNAYRAIQGTSTPGRCWTPASRQCGTSGTTATMRARVSGARSTPG